MKYNSPEWKKISGEIMTHCDPVCPKCGSSAIFLKSIETTWYPICDINDEGDYSIKIKMGDNPNPNDTEILEEFHCKKCYYKIRSESELFEICKAQGDWIE